jgi:hypothetical protein
MGVAYRAVAGGRRTVWVLGALVVSHWLLDVASHRPDMPLYPGSATYGLGLWNSVPATLAIETGLFVAGLRVYAATTTPSDRVGRWGLLCLGALLLTLYVGNLWSVPPPSPVAIAIVSLAGAGLIVGCAWWVDRHRVVRTAPRQV